MKVASFDIQSFNKATPKDTKVEEVGIGGFRFYAKISETTNYVSQAPVSYLEDGSYVSDHIILEPLTLDIQGSVSSVYVDAKELEARQSYETDPIALAVSYTKKRFPQEAQKIKNFSDDVQTKYNTIANKVNQIAQAYKVGDNTSVDFMRKFVEDMERYYYSKQLISIETLFKTHEAMRITNLSITRDNKNDALSFTIQAQKVRIAETTYSKIDKVFAKPSKATQGQTEAKEDKGSQSVSLASGISKAFSTIF